MPHKARWRPPWPQRKEGGRQQPCPEGRQSIMLRTVQHVWLVGDLPLCSVTHVCGQSTPHRPASGRRLSRHRPKPSPEGRPPATSGEALPSRKQTAGPGLCRALSGSPVNTSPWQVVGMCADARKSESVTSCRRVRETSGAGRCLALLLSETSHRSDVRKRSGKG